LKLGFLLASCLYIYIYILNVATLCILQITEDDDPTWNLSADEIRGLFQEKRRKQFAALLEAGEISPEDYLVGVFTVSLPAHPHTRARSLSLSLPLFHSPSTMFFIFSVGTYGSAQERITVR
jgi:hypothetical protein